MKQINLAKPQAEIKPENGMQKFWGSIQGILTQLGITLEGEGDAAETVVRRFNRLLDNRYTMLRDVSLPRESRRVPLVLVGPPGVVVINPRNDAGVFRAREDAWVVMNRRTQKYEEAPENLLVQTDGYAQRMAAYLSQGETPVTEIQPLLVLASPGAHVESSRPIVRILPFDALDRYIAALVQGRAVLSGEAVQELVEALSTPPVEPAPEEPVVIEPPKPKKSPPPLSGEIKLPPALAKYNLTKPQWTLIAVMAGIEFILLIFLILFVFLNS
jgi:hypothetical protein